MEKPEEKARAAPGGANAEPSVEDMLQPDFDAVALGENEDVWFGADELAHASRVDIGKGSRLEGGYSAEELARDRERFGVDLSVLPGWPGSAPSGHGWGPTLSERVGDLYPGRRILVDAVFAGQGRTGFVLQVADGLALRNAESLPPQGAKTPVVVLAEDGREDAGRRSVARWTGQDLRIFRLGEAFARRLDGQSEQSVARAFDQATAALEGPLRAREPFLRFVSPAVRGPDIVPLLAEQVSVWREQLGDGGAAVWPVLVTDSLDRWAADDSSEALADLAASLSSAARQFGWIWLATTRGAGGSLDAWFDLRIELDSQAASRVCSVRVAHNRVGPTGGQARFAWDPACGRYAPAD